MNRPRPGDYAPYFENYIKLTKGNDFLELMRLEHDQTQDLLATIDNERGNFRYADGKWSIKEVLAHMIDTERIFNYRALSIARGDQTPLPGYNHDAYVQSCNANNRNLDDVMGEYQTLRQSTIDLFSSFNTFMLQSKGIANEKEITVEAIGFIIPGHEIHHRNVLVEKYGLSVDEMNN